jgi:hypothetical protein
VNSSDERPLPQTFLRGLWKSGLVSPDGKVLGAAFVPSAKTADNRKLKNHLPAGEEASINWRDNDQALELLRQNRTLGGHGITETKTDVVGSVNAFFKATNDPSFVHAERRVEEASNPYHGNLVYVDSCSSPAKKLAASMIAHASTLL